MSRAWVIAIAVAFVLLIVVPLVVFGIGSNEDSNGLTHAVAAS